MAYSNDVFLADIQSDGDIGQEIKMHWKENKFMQQHQVVVAEDKNENIFFWSVNLWCLHSEKIQRFGDKGEKLAVCCHLVDSWQFLLVCHDEGHSASWWSYAVWMRHSEIVTAATNLFSMSVTLTKWALLMWMRFAICWPMSSILSATTFNAVSEDLWYQWGDLLFYCWGWFCPSVLKFWNLNCIVHS